MVNGTNDEGSVRPGKAGPSPCERCGATLVPIVYGMPGPELLEQAERGEVVIGGCVIMGDDPTHGCPNCYRDMQWGRFT